jgi:site-specific DNA recombinase
VVVAGTPTFPDGPGGIGYYRQSKSDPDGIERQREKVRAMFAAMGVNLLAEYEDNDVSATKGKRRPGYEKAMAHLAKLEPGDILGLSKMARLYRKTIELENIIPLIEKTGVLVRSVETSTLDLSSPNGRMVARMLVAAAQAEVEEKADRQKSANLQDARAGKRNRTGIRPFGYMADRVTPLEAEAQAVGDAADAVLAGGSLQSVMRDWTSRGVKPPFHGRTNGAGELLTSGTWNQTTIRRILLNPQIAGLRVYRGEIIGDGDWTPLITPEKWHAVKAVLTDAGRVMPRGAVTLLGGLAVCSCGNRVKHGVRRNSKRQRAPYGVYRCDTSTVGDRPGPHVNIQAGVIDRYVQDVLLETLSREPELFARDTGGADVAKLRREAGELTAGLEQSAGDAAMGIIPRSVYLGVAERVGKRLAEIDAMIEEAGRQDALALLLSADDIEAEWAGFDVTIKRAVISAVCSRVILRSPGCGCRNPDLGKMVTFRWRADPAAEQDQ